MKRAPALPWFHHDLGSLKHPPISPPTPGYTHTSRLESPPRLLLEVPLRKHIRWGGEWGRVCCFFPLKLCHYHHPAVPRSAGVASACCFFPLCSEPSTPGLSFMNHSLLSPGLASGRAAHTQTHHQDTDFPHQTRSCRTPRSDRSVCFRLPTSSLGVPATTFKDKTALPRPITLWGLHTGRGGAAADKDRECTRGQEGVLGLNIQTLAPPELHISACGECGVHAAWALGDVSVAGRTS